MALLTGSDPNWSGDQDFELDAMPRAPDEVVDIVVGSPYLIANADTTAIAFYRVAEVRPEASAPARRLGPGESVLYTGTASRRSWFWSLDADGCSLVVS